MVDTHINIWLKFCNVWAAATCPCPSRFGFMQGESKTSWFRKINKTWRVCPHFHSARLANTTWPTQSLVDGDAVVLADRPSPVHRANAATLHATWHAPVKKLFTASQCGYPRLKFLDYHHIWLCRRWVPAKCAASCLIFWKKKCFTEMIPGIVSRHLAMQLASSSFHVLISLAQWQNQQIPELENTCF